MNSRLSPKDSRCDPIGAKPAIEHILRLFRFTLHASRFTSYFCEYHLNPLLSV